MYTINDKPAFPMHPISSPGYGGGPERKGMTLLEYYAGQAMVGDWAAQGNGSIIIRNDWRDSEMEARARLYFRMAQAMLKVSAEYDD